MILLVDNYDSFTFNLKDYLEQLGQEVMVLRNKEEALLSIDDSQFQGIVLSPGPGIPSESGFLMEVIDKNWKRLPILGICLGHQALGVYFRAELVRGNYPMHGKISEIYHNRHEMFNGLPARFEVCQYHSLVLKGGRSVINEQLEVTGWSEDNTIMAIAHKTRPLWGVQYHPEAILTQQGLALLNNWVNVINLHRIR